MNKKGIIALIGIVLVVAGLCGALFLNYTVSDIISLVTTFFGSGLVLYSILGKKEGKKWYDYLFLILISVGSVLFVFGGFDKETTLALVGALITVIGTIFYIIFGRKPVEK